MSALALIAVGASVCAGCLVVVGVAILRDRSRELDATLDELLDSDPDDDTDDEPELPVALEPAEVMAMTPGQIAAILAPLDWPVHPSLRRGPRPRRRDPFDFFADGGM